jgi:putative Mg2+ transporter-C (MgtC) family protein
MRDPAKEVSMLENWYYRIYAWGESPWISVAPLSWISLLACLLAGGTIGLERQWQGKPIGIRTSVLICMGTYVFVAIGATNVTSTTDPTRIIGQVITGIGFLGAGVMLTRDGMVVGATSAASIWVLAAIGVVIAEGSPFLGIKLASIAVAILVGINALEERCPWLQRGMHQRTKAVPAARQGAESPVPPTDSRLD